MNKNIADINKDIIDCIYCNDLYCENCTNDKVDTGYCSKRCELDNKKDLKLLEESLKEDKIQKILNKATKEVRKILDTK